MAETLLFIQRQDFPDYEALAKSAEDAASRTRELTAKIKTVEARMAEISVLKTHIINYSTRCLQGLPGGRVFKEILYRP